ncbi:MAG: type II toxin-antitoxin system ParD family antitoxin [Magnetococcales bacterium]|nr:type II toxin-antitoxin system ParD family antitoxin [Magnetococcales bacterium]
MQKHKMTRITVGSHFEGFINQQIAQGRFDTASEAVRAGLQLLEERETSLSALRLALREGEESGTTDYSLQRLIEELDSESVNGCQPLS